jgi:hypothetical protein
MNTEVWTGLSEGFEKLIRMMRDLGKMLGKGV